MSKGNLQTIFELYFYRRRLRRVIAAPPNNSPKQSARTVWGSSPFQGSVCRGHGENNCNDFCLELYLLGHRYKLHVAAHAQAQEISDIEKSYSRPAPFCMSATNLKGYALCRRPPLSGRGLRGGGYVVLAHLLC